MSDIASTGTNPTAPLAARAAIARAAQKTGVDFDYLLAQAKLESGLNPGARARTSSATGLYQFVSGTWLDTLKKHGAEHGLGWASAATADPALRGQVMALRNDPDISALMAAELAGDNRIALSAALGREPDSAELYLAHFLGAHGAGQFLSALATDPSAPASRVVPGAAAANRAIFFAPGGAPRSLQEVMDLLRTRLVGAMEGGDAARWADAFPPGALPSGSWPGPSAGQAPLAGGPVARAFHSAAAGAVGAAGAQPSMAETLRQTFNVGMDGAGAGASGGAPDHVRHAYRRLAALGL